MNIKLPKMIDGTCVVTCMEKWFEHIDDPNDEIGITIDFKYDIDHDDIARQFAQHGVIVEWFDGGVFPPKPSRPYEGSWWDRIEKKYGYRKQ